MQGDWPLSLHALPINRINHRISSSTMNQSGRAAHHERRRRHGACTRNVRCCWRTVTERTDWGGRRGHGTIYDAWLRIDAGGA